MEKTCAAQVTATTGSLATFDVPTSGVNVYSLRSGKITMVHR